VATPKQLEPSQPEMTDALRQQMRLNAGRKTKDGHLGVEKLLLTLFETSKKSFKHVDAIKSKLQDKTVSLNPLGANQSGRKKVGSCRTTPGYRALNISCVPESGRSFTNWFLKSVWMCDNQA
jgi:hypothetical protein